MRVVIQRVNFASVEINDNIFSSINEGLLIFVGIETEDTLEDAEWISGKISQLRIFNDEKGIMNKSIIDIDGEMLVVSQFTLHAQTKKGNRPSYMKAAKHEISRPLYDECCNKLSEKIGKTVKKGVFAADMKINLRNDGPVTILMDSKNKE